MTTVDQLHSLMVRRLAFPLVNYALNRTNILHHYRTLRESQQYAVESLRAMQLEKLIRIVQHAYRYCPYYTQRCHQIGLLPKDIKRLEDVQQLPPLSRQEVIDYHHEMVDRRYQSSIPMADQMQHTPGAPVWWARWRQHRLIRNVSTGSTGAPTVFYEDGTRTALNWAHELRVKDWYGCKPGVKEARLARVSTEYLPKSKLLRVRRLLWNQLILPGMNLSVREYELALRKLQEFRPRVLFGITSALTGLADYIHSCGEAASSWHPELVISWAAPLFEHEKKLLEEIFHCPVTNIYGSREVGHVAAMCPQGSLHLNQEDFLVEIETSPQQAFSTGPGELLVTPLNLSPMPFLRYRIGDVGELSRAPCPCGRPLQVIQHLLGRSGEAYVTQDGRMIAPNFWCRMFMIDQQSQAVQKFQIVYQKNGAVRFRIVRKPNYTMDTEAALRRILQQNFGTSMRFEFEYVPEIKPHPSGKYQLVINECV